MKMRILWIEDDYYIIKGLVLPLEKAGFNIDIAKSALIGYQKAREWKNYDLILLDLILPSADDDKPLPDLIRTWDQEEFIGLGLVKWLFATLKVEVPVILLSVIEDPISTYHLEELGVSEALLKRGLLPSQVKATVFKTLGIQE